MLALQIEPEDHRRVWAIAWPMILTGLSTPLLGMVDTAVMGHLPDPYFLGAVAVGATIINFIFWTFGFLRMGTTGITAQAHGGENGTEMRAVLARALLLAIGFAAVILLFQAPLAWLAYELFDAGADVERESLVYYNIRVWGAPAALANYVLWGWFLGMQNARATLCVMLTVNGLNIVLDIVFVVGLGFDAAGVAIASVIAEFSGTALGAGLVVLELRKYPGQWDLEKITNMSRLRHMMHVNQNILIRTLCLLFAFSFFMAQSARHGEVILAVNAVLQNFVTFMAFGLDGFAHAAEALVGKAVGARDRAALKRCLRATCFWSGCTAVIFTLVYLFAGGLIVDLLTDLPAVRAAAVAFTPWVVASPLISVWAFWLDGVFIGMTRAVEMRNTMLISLLLIYLPAWYLLQPWGNHGLWAALLLFMAARGVTMFVVLRRIGRT
ncbi:MAG: MATE family efflux transporter [Gammaproteobacteria bacterium]